MTSPVTRADFASDNTAGICPEALSALFATNAGRMASYGNDELTRQACNRIRALFDTDCDVFFVFNGTAANALVTLGAAPAELTWRAGVDVLVAAVRTALLSG